MIELDQTRFRLKPYLHQLRGVSTLLRNPLYGLFWKMRLGKSKAVLDAACTLYEVGEIDTVVICCPAQVKDVWLNKDFGEIVSHSWVHTHVFDYVKKREENLPHSLYLLGLTFVVASFEFLRQEDARSDFPKVRALLDALKKGKRKTYLVLDEGSALGTWNSLQVKAMMTLRYSETIKRVTVLDGTPAGNSTLSIYSKFALLDKKILGVKNFWQFRGRYATAVKQRMAGGRSFLKIVGFKNLDDLSRRTQPYCEYLGQETLDMPRKVQSLLTVTLSPPTWKVYKQMRDEMLAELDSGTLAVNHAAVKALRLAQICSGFLGGWGNPDDPTSTLTKEIGRESLDVYLRWLMDRLQEEPELMTVVWCRWRPEIARLLNELPQEIGISAIFGGENRDVDYFHPSSTVKGPRVLVGQPQAAQYGLNFSRASSVTYLSQDYNLITREQSEDRVQAPKVRATTLMTDVLVSGPNGESTIVHDVVKVLRTKEDLARRTTDRWKEVLSGE